MSDPHLMGLISSGNLRLAAATVFREEHPAHAHEFSRALSFEGINHHLDDSGRSAGTTGRRWKHMMRMTI